MAFDGGSLKESSQYLLLLSKLDRTSSAEACSRGQKLLAPTPLNTPVLR